MTAHDVRADTGRGGDAHCLVCGLRLSTAHEWCYGTRDGEHRPNLSRPTPPATSEEPA